LRQKSLVLDYPLMESFEHALEAVGTLADDLRRRMYLFIRDRGRPVSRDEAAEAVGISRKLAAFHLDKLIEKGLLRAHYRRLSGRSGPGAGRPSKVYEPAEVEVTVSIPSRSYDFAGSLLVSALERTPAKSRAAVRTAAWDQGQSLGLAVRRERRLRSPSPKKLLAVAREVLYERGYEPYIDEDGGLQLRNCPFHVLAQQSVEIVCRLNQAFISGLLSGLGGKLLDAALDPQPGQCCVRIRSAGVSA
jgi:predicted ArsR family transcriptional regulator